MPMRDMIEKRETRRRPGAADQDNQGETMKVELKNEHQWLQKLVGEWTYEMENPCKPGEAPTKCVGTESVRSLGGLWITAEGKGEMPDGEPATTILTVGYDSRKKGYVGTWIGSMMDYLWVYTGSVDAAGKTLTLETEGPSMAGDGKMAKYKEVIEFETDDHRVFTSNVLGDDGNWSPIMTTHYYRKT
jgi:hypothetical protein